MRSNMCKEFTWPVKGFPAFILDAFVPAIDDFVNKQILYALNANFVI